MNKSIRTNAHDKFFRKVMGNPHVARDFLLTHLPEKMRKIMDLNDLELVPRSYIDDVRKETIADVLYKTTIADRVGYIYLLVEHQSSPDELMPFRILKYSCNIIEQHLQQTKSKSLPLIYPMVIYHGERPYSFSTDIKDIVDAPRQLIEQYFLKPFQLIDLARIDDEELKKHSWAGAMEFALKHIFARDILPHLKEMAELLRRIDQAGGKDYISIILHYIYERAELKSKEAFFNLISTKISTEVGEEIMTLAEQMRQEGRFEGKLQGKLEGEREKSVEIAKRLLNENLDILFISKVTGLSLNELKNLQKQTDIVN